MKKLLKPFFALFLVALVAVSCQKDNGTDLTKLLNQDIYSLMQEIYLWYDHLPDVDPRSYDTPEAGSRRDYYSSPNGATA